MKDEPANPSPTAAEALFSAALGFKPSERSAYLTGACGNDLDLFIQVCHAIQHAHQKGIIHRDIKPSNVLVSLHDGVPVPVVIDFGIAKATAQQRLTDKTLFTAFEQFIGTPAYMSPEQAEMSRLDIDTRSDIYALGVLLYELLTGQTPFDAKTLLAAGLDEMRRIIREQEPVRPSTRLTQKLVAADVRRLKSPGPEAATSAEEIRASSRRLLQLKELIPLLRGDLDWIVMKCLEKDRTRRYETANGLALDIERHLTHEPVVARPPSTVYRAQKFIRRNKIVVTAAGLVAATLFLGTAVSAWQAVRATRAEREQSRQRRLAVENEQKALQAQSNEAAQRQVAETRAEESRQRLVQVNVANGVRLMNEGQLFASLPWLVEALRLEEGNPEGEDLQRLRLGTVLQQCPQLAQIWFHDGPVNCAVFSPDGRRVATGTGRIVRFMPDKSTPGQAQVWDVETGERVGQPIRHRGSISRLRFSPDGRTIATASADNTARVWDADNGQAVTPPLRHDGGVQQATFSADGRWVVTASWDQTVRLWSATTGDPIAPPIRLGEGVRDARLSADGRRLVAAGGSAAQVWNLSREACPVADLVLLSQLLTGQAADAQGRVMPLGADAVKQAWRTLKAKAAQPQGGAPATVRAWHRQALAQALKQQQRFAARFHLDRLLELMPGDESLRRLRAGMESGQADSTAGGETASDAFAEGRSRVPPPAMGAPENLIDLSDYYDRPLNEARSWWLEFNNLSSLPRGIQTLAGVQFDLRGFVNLQGAQAKGYGYSYPERITGIRLRPLCRRLQLLHGTMWEEAEGKEIAKYVIHFADGQQSEQPVRYGKDVQNFWLKVGDPPERRDAVRAWVGTNALTAETGVSFRLYKSVWENPRPDVPVETIDFISTMSDCAPFLIAITAE